MEDCDNLFQLLYESCHVESLDNISSAAVVKGHLVADDPRSHKWEDGNHNERHVADLEEVNLRNQSCEPALKADVTLNDYSKHSHSQFGVGYYNDHLVVDHEDNDFDTLISVHDHQFFEPTAAEVNIDVQVEVPMLDSWDLFNLWFFDDIDVPNNCNICEEHDPGKRKCTNQIDSENPPSTEKGCRSLWWMDSD